MKEECFAFYSLFPVTCFERGVLVGMSDSEGLGWQASEKKRWNTMVFSSEIARQGLVS